MLKVSEIIIVEGKHDKVKLSAFIDGTIIATNGFRIFKDKEKQNLIRNYALKNDIIILTDSDSAGFVIRNFLKSILPNTVTIKNAYIPQVLGKEKRKEAHSKEGFLGVEGLCKATILDTLEGVFTTKTEDVKPITKQDFFKLGLTGGENSSVLRGMLTTKLNIPSYITTNALIEYVNSNLTYDDFLQIVSEF